MTPDSFSNYLSMSLPINVLDLCEGRFDNIDDKYHECTQTIHVIDGRVCVVCRPTSSSNKIIAPPDHQNHMVDEILIKSVCICAVALEKIKVESFLWKFHQIRRRYDFHQLKMVFIDRIKWNVL